MKRLIGTVLGLWLGQLVSGPAQAAVSKRCDPCNVLWIVVDTTRADRIDSELTPNIMRLASRGTRYQHAYSQAPATMLSVSSYMSGRYRRSTGQDFSISKKQADTYHTLSPELTTVAEVLKGAGYRVDGFNANPVISASSSVGFDLGLYQGFDTWVQGDDQQVVDWGADALEKLRDGGEPFLLYLHLFGPHSPNDQLDGFEARRGVHEQSIGEGVFSTLYGKINRGEQEVDEGDIAYIRALYDDALWVADRQVGQVLDRLAELEMNESTLVILTSDHGEALGDFHDPHPRFGHSKALIDSMLHVPLILAGPGIRRGVLVRNQVAELVDLAPTIADYLGIPVQADWRWDGSPLVGSQASPGSTAISDRGGELFMQTGIRDRERAVRYSAKQDQWAYYSLDPEPKEEAGHVLGAPTTEHQQLQVVLQHYMDTAVPPGQQGEELSTPEGDELEALQALGYME